MASEDTPDPAPPAVDAPPALAEQERLIADHEARHGPLPARILVELRSAERHGQTAGTKAAGAVGTSAEALHLEVVATDFTGARALAGHVLGLRLLIPAEGIHGPREAPALLYLFRDALALRPTDDAPMSAIPLCGLHMVMPHVAMARWVYKAGRTAHANLNLARQEAEFQAALSHWTADEFKEATSKLQVHPLAQVPEPVRLYEHLGFVRLDVPVVGGPPVRLKSALLEPAAAYLRMWKLFDAVPWPHGLTMEEPPDAHTGARAHQGGAPAGPEDPMDS